MHTIGADIPFPEADSAGADRRLQSLGVFASTLVVEPAQRDILKRPFNPGHDTLRAASRGGIGDQKAHLTRGQATAKRHFSRIGRGPAILEPLAKGRLIVRLNQLQQVLDRGLEGVRRHTQNAVGLLGPEDTAIPPITPAAHPSNPLRLREHCPAITDRLLGRSALAQVTQYDHSAGGGPGVPLHRGQRVFDLSTNAVRRDQ